jgi:hypothetical protein
MTDHIPLAPLREVRLSEKEKSFIRNNILAHQRKSLFLRKVFFVTRITWYVAVSTFGVFVLVSSYLPQPTGITPEDGALYSVLHDGQQWIVQADTIGRLLEIQWVVHVLQNGIIVPKTEIAAGEIVVLQPGAELVLQVRAATFAKITGPAKFVLEYIPETNQTVLNLLEGKLIEVTTHITPLSTEHAAEMSTESTPANKKVAAVTDNVVIKTKFVEVTAPQDQTSNFVIEQEDKEAEVIAKSGNILVKQLIDFNTNTPSDTEQMLVDAGERAHIDTAGIAIYTPKTEDELVQLALQSKELQIRYETTPESTDLSASTATLLSEDTTTTALLDESADQVALLSAKAVEDDVLVELSKKTNPTNEKKVLSPELLSSLSQTLHQAISAENIAQMRQRKEENTNAYIIAYSNLLEQLNRAYTLLWAHQPSTSTDSLGAGIRIAQNLLTLLETEYATPPSLRTAVVSIINWLTALQAPVEEHNAPDLPAPVEWSSTTPPEKSMLENMKEELDDIMND